MSDIPNWNTVDFELKIPFGRVQVARGTWDRPIDYSMALPTHHLELSLLTKLDGDPQACFVDLWGPSRFEPFGEMFFLPADQHVHFKSRSQQQHSVICEFSPEFLSEWLAQEVSWAHQVPSDTLNITNPRLRSLFHQILREVRFPGFASEAMINLLASQIAIELNRHSIEKADMDVTGSLAAWRLRLIDQRLADETSIPTLKELADLCQMSVRHLRNL